MLGGAEAGAKLQRPELNREKNDHKLFGWLPGDRGRWGRESQVPTIRDLAR